MIIQTASICICLSNVSFVSTLFKEIKHYRKQNHWRLNQVRLFFCLLFDDESFSYNESLCVKLCFVSETIPNDVKHLNANLTLILFCSKFYDVLLLFLFLCDCWDILDACNNNSHNEIQTFKFYRPHEMTNIIINNNRSDVSDNHLKRI